MILAQTVHTNHRNLMQTDVYEYMLMSKNLCLRSCLWIYVNVYVYDYMK